MGQRPSIAAQGLGGGGGRCVASLRTRRRTVLQGDLGAGHAIPRLARWALTNLDGQGGLQRGSVEDPARSPGHALEQFERELWLLAKQAAEGVSFDPNRHELRRGDHGRSPALAVQESELSEEVTRSKLGLAARGDLAFHDLRLAIDVSFSTMTRPALYLHENAGEAP